MEALTITKIDNDLLALRKTSWMTPEAIDLMRQLRPGEMLEVTGLVNASSPKTAQVSLRLHQTTAGLAHLSTCRRKDRLFAIYWPEQRDGTA